MILTFDIMESAKSINGGWNSEQLAAIGVSYPLKKGWIREVLNKEFSEDEILKFKSLANVRFENKGKKHIEKILNKKATCASDIKGTSYGNNKRLSYLRAAKKYVMAFAKSQGVPTKGMKLIVAMRIFANRNGLEMGLKRHEWLIDVYLSRPELFKGDIKQKTRKIKKDKSVPLISKAEHASYKKFLKGSYWMYVRNLVFKRDGKVCSRCQSVKTLQIHHTTYANHFNEHNHLDDLIILCRLCHEKEHEINT